MDIGTAEKASMSVQLSQRLSEGRDLLKAAESLNSVPGTSKLTKKIRQEIRFLERSDKPLKKEHLECSNLTHLKAVVVALKASQDPCDVMKTFQYEHEVAEEEEEDTFGMVEGSKKVAVDVVCDQGFTWIKVVARNAKALDLSSQGCQQFGQRSILEQAEQYMACAKQNPKLFQPPKVQFAFFNGISDSVKSAIQDTGVQVLGPDLRPLTEPVATSFVSNNESVSEDLGGRPDEFLNLDITAMVAYVSSLTNGHCNYNFKEKILSEQAARERECHAKPFLDLQFKSKKLICCQSAAKDFQTITDTLAGPEEKARVKRLMSSLHAVVQDVMSERIAKLELSGKIKRRSLAIFGTGDFYQVVTLTANIGFVRAAHGQGIDLAVLMHESRALTEGKMKTASWLPPSQFPVLDRIPLISVEEFRRKYLIGNVPVLLKSSCGIMRDWRCVEKWTDDSGKPDVSALQEDVRASSDKLTVPVYNCHQKYFNSQECCEWKLDDYVNYWKKRNTAGDLLYLKDWHLFQDNPRLADLYRVPSYFASDWLNEFLDHRLSSGGEDNVQDYKFVYVGPRGSWTPFHSDVFGSFSWSANVVGRKEWLFFPPGEELKLKSPDFSSSGSKLAHNVATILPEKNCDLKNGRLQTFEYEGQEIRFYRVVQESQDLVFVPSGWYHQVTNLEDTISINHNWFNGANVNRILANMETELSNVEKEISDCKASCSSDLEWQDMCQGLLKASFGMDFRFLIDLCLFIADKRIKAAASTSDHDGQDFLQYELRKLSTIMHKIQTKICLQQKDSAAALAKACIEIDQLVKKCN